MVVTTPRPRLLLFAERPGWALHTIARAIARYTQPWLDTTIVTQADPLPADADRYDLMHTLFYEDRRYLSCYSARSRLIQSVYSHRWELKGMSPQELHNTYLRDAVRITVPTPRLLHALQVLPLPVHLTPEGVDTQLFCPAAEGRTGKPIAGWAGKADDPIKQLPLIQRACEGVMELRIADGSMNEKEMVDFYQSIDIIICASKAEGCPRPLLEGMACGAFPVSFPVGVAPEVISHSLNGLLVAEATEEALRSALVFCTKHIDTLRLQSPQTIERIRATRDWVCVLPHLEQIYRSLLPAGNEGKQTP